MNGITSCAPWNPQAWQIQETANLLGISRKNLWEKMKRLAIRKEPL